MTDYTELKRLALGLPDKPWHAAHANAGGRGWEVVQGVDQVAADLTEARAKFIAAANPAAILALIAELERTGRLLDQGFKAIDRINAKHRKAWFGKLGVAYPNYGGFPDKLEIAEKERDQFKAEVDRLRGYLEVHESVEPLNAADRKCLAARGDQYERDAARYRFLRSRDLNTIAMGGVFAGMTPQNLVINEETLDEAVDAAMSKEAGHD